MILCISKRTSRLNTNNQYDDKNGSYGDFTEFTEISVQYMTVGTGGVPPIFCQPKEITLY